MSFCCPLGEEPGPEAEIKEFASRKYSVTFDMFSKINVNGEADTPNPPRAILS